MKNAFSALVLLFVLSLAGKAEAQSTLAWDMPNTTQADAQSYTYRVYLNAATVGTVATGVTCTAAGSPSVTTCRLTLVGLTPGKYSVQLTAANSVGESAKSVVLAFSTLTIPNVPFNLRIELNLTATFNR